MQYQYVCAQALNKIFYWNKLEWGKIIRYQENFDSTDETIYFLMRKEEANQALIYAQENWIFYEELIEIVGLFSEEIFENAILEEIAAVWGVFLEWG